MRTISVKEAAQALGLTPRAVSYRLEKGHLKGTLTKNEATGVPEWRIHPNKEILAGLNQTKSETSASIDFEPNDVIDAESVSDTTADASEQQSQPRPNTNDFQFIVEQCVRPLVEEVKAQALALAERDRIIEDQSRQLRLLPDLEKQANDEKFRAEAERKTSEMNKLEAIALRKQIEALEAERTQSAEAKIKVIELEQALVESKADAQLEIERIRQEKDAQATAIQQKLEELSKTVIHLQQPWWKKWISSTTTGSST